MTLSSSSQTSMNSHSPTVLQNGRYAIETQLGQGNFGTTFRARDAHLEQPVAIKTLNPNLGDRQQFERFQQQFIADARRIAQCWHGSLVRVCDCFEQEGIAYIVMEYVPGQTLAELARSGTTFSLTKCLYYIRQLGAALGALHQQGVLHGDVRPDNILRRQGTEVVVLTDFGITRGFTAGTRQTHAGMLSSGYAAIEAYGEREQLSRATDVYALAATFYYLLSGQAPVAAPLRDRIPLTPISKLRPNVPAAIETAIERGLAVRGSDRPQTVEEWLKLLPSRSDLLKAKQAVKPAPEPVRHNPEVESAPSSAWVPWLFVATSAIAMVGGASLGFTLLDNSSKARSAPDRSSPSPSLSDWRDLPELPSAEERRRQRSRNAPRSAPRHRLDSELTPTYPDLPGHTPYPDPDDSQFGRPQQDSFTRDRPDIMPESDPAFQFSERDGSDYDSDAPGSEPML